MPEYLKVLALTQQSLAWFMFFFSLNQLLIRFITRVYQHKTCANTALLLAVSAECFHKAQHSQ